MAQKKMATQKIQQMTKQVGFTSETLTEKVEKFTTLFDFYDDLDGVLDKSEVEAMVNGEKMKIDKKKFYQFLDFDKDGKITKEEFVKAAIGLNVEEIFDDSCKKYDANKDKYLDVSEITSALKDCGFPNPTKKAVEKKMKKCDTNNDGKVSYDEFIVGFLKDRFGLKYTPKKMIGCSNATLSEKVAKYTELFDLHCDMWSDGLAKENVIDLLKSEGFDNDPEKFFKFCDADDDGEITKQEFIQAIVGTTVEDMFGDMCKKYDKNGDGYLDACEIAAAIKDCGFPAPSDEAVKQKMEKCDTNKDGKITYDEFIVGFLKGRFGLEYTPKKMIGCSNDSLSKKIREFSSMFDLHCDLWADGLSKENVEAMLKENGYENDLETFFKFCDADADGMITKQEFIQAIIGSSVEKIFKELCVKYDPNGDGRLSAVEIKYALIDSGFEAPSDEEIKKKMEKCDVNKDGKVTYQEFIVQFLKGRYGL